MSYEPHTWTTGELITAEKLNAMEQGIGTSGEQDTLRENEDGTFTIVKGGGQSNE